LNYLEKKISVSSIKEEVSTVILKIERIIELPKGLCFRISRDGPDHYLGYEENLYPRRYTV